MNFELTKDYVTKIEAAIDQQDETLLKTELDELYPPDIANLIYELDGQQADFIFIDGDHTIDGVTADYNDYREFARPGGIIAFHDIGESQPLATNQVYHLWKKLKQTTVTEEFVNDSKQCGFGIGILRIPRA